MRIRRFKLYILLVSSVLLTLFVWWETQPQAARRLSPSATAEAQNVELVGHIGGATNAVFVRGNYAYIGVGPRLTILDISDPLSLTVMGETTPFPDIVKDVYVSGNYAYVANDEEGLRVVNVSTLTNPIEVGFYDTPGNAEGVYVSGSTAYIADGINGGLRVVDVSTPISPTEDGFYNTPGNALGVYISGTVAYVADGNRGLRVVNVSDPEHPTEVGSYDTPGNAEGVYVSGNTAYVADGAMGGLRVVNVSDPAHPSEIGFYIYSTLRSARGVYVSGSTAYVAYGSGSLRVVDVSDPANPTEVGFYDTPGEAEDVYIDEDNAYVADYGGGLRVVDVSEPDNPAGVSSYDLLGEVWDVHVSGGNAYIADRRSGLRVVDVSDPAHLTKVGSYDTPGDAYGVYVSGSTAYIADWGSGLRVIDVSDQAHPNEIGSYDTPGDAYDVYVSGTVAYVADGNSGLQVVDVSIPISPTRVGSYNTPGSARGVYVSGSIAYVADWGGGLRMIDVSIPISPTEIGSYDTPGLAEGVYVSDSIAYIADEDLQIVDVSDPAHPTGIGSHPTPSSTEGVYISGNVAYVADGSDGLRVVDVSDPAHSTEIGHYNTPQSANNVYVIDSTVYVADYDAGLIILHPTLDVPTLNPIANADEDGNYTVDWSDVTNAVSYTLQEDNSAAFISPTILYNGSDSQYVVSGQVTGIWYYRVRASNVASNSKWSNVESVVVKPDTPTLDPISNFDKDGNYTVDWSDVTGVVSYTLQEDDNAGFTSPVILYNGSDSQYVVNGQAAGTWYYQVKASSAAGDSEWSNIESTSVYTLMSNVIISGPATGLIQTAYTFTATISPPTVTLPITYSWQATGQDDVMMTTEALSHTATFTWSTTGMQVITVTAMNVDSTVNNTHTITILDAPTHVVSISKSVTPTVAIWGQRITYTLTYSNVGSNPITGVMITDTLPSTLIDIDYTSSGAQITSTGSVSFVWQVEDLAPGQGGVITVTATISSELTGDATIVNQAIINNEVGSVSAVSSATIRAVSPQPKAPWTVMIYLNGDNNLDNITDDAFNNMEKGICRGRGLGITSPDVNVIVLWDRKSGTGGDWEPGTRRYEVKCNKDRYELADYVEGVNTWDDGELNLGNAQTLYDFVFWAQTKYPADHYWLSIADHGGGWSAQLPPGMPRAGGWYQGGAGLSWDETGMADDPDYLSTHEMGKVLRNLHSEGADFLDIVFYDACLMGMLEEAYEIKDYARYFIASENISRPNTPFPYNSYIRFITAQTQPAELAKYIVKIFIETQTSVGTVAALDLSVIDDVAEAVDDMAQALMAEQSSAFVRENILEAYRKAQKFDYDDDHEEDDDEDEEDVGDRIEQHTEGYVDLYDLAEYIKQGVDSVAIADAAQRVMTATSEFVFDERHKKNLGDAHGVSIYLPLGEELYIGSGCDEDEAVLDPCKVHHDPDCIKLRDYYTTTTPPHTQQLSFAQDTAWDEFVNSFIDVYYCNVPTMASVLHLHKTGMQDSPLVRPIAILNEPRRGVYVDEWDGKPIGGVTISFNREYRTLVIGTIEYLAPRSDRPQAVYLPSILRDR